MILSEIHWDPPREAFTIPFFDHPVVWYGILFVLGFIFAYFIINPILARFLVQTAGLTTATDFQRVFGPSITSPKKAAYALTDRLCWFIVAGTIIGARLGEVFFYDWPYYQQHPAEIFKVWQGGLASHGGVAGVALSIYLFVKTTQSKIPQLTFLRLLDMVAIPSALVAAFIRLGNFMNQEILGIPTDLPWGVVFGHPAGGGPAIARHPVQLYEAVAYLIAFVILWKFWKSRPSNATPGAFVGLLFIFIFGSRFILEYWKSPQESIFHSSFLQIGQLFSLPFLILGIFFFWRALNGKNCKSL